MHRLQIFRVYLRLAMPLRRLRRLPFHADHATCTNDDCPLCFEQTLW